MRVAELAVNTLRFLAVDAVEAAASGHPGLPMGGAPMAYVLWTRFLRHSPSAPHWPDRDRFILSAGHGSMLLYALLHLSGYDLPLEEIKSFRQWGSMTPGHPEYGHTPGVETTTGPLGQGFANAVGMAVAERRLAAEFNRPGYNLMDHYTYVYCGDGCLMEGVTAEAASLAGHLKLGRLICLYDDNRITIDGSTAITFTEDVARRFAAYGWQVLQVNDGTDQETVAEAIKLARSDLARPSLLMVRTEIGYGSPGKQGTAEAHGAPLGTEETRLAKEKLGWPLEPSFFVPPEVREHFDSVRKGLEQHRLAWEALYADYRRRYPEEAARFAAWQSLELPEELEREPLLWQHPQPAATRVSSGQVLQLLARHLTNLLGGSADLNASTKTYLKNSSDFQPPGYNGNNIFFGVREHAMAAVLNGLALHGGCRPYGATFLVFADYMRPAIRLAALMKLPVVYVFTHDSIAVGEDGPTHQPVEQLASLRIIPQLHVLRPADGRETAAAWLAALRRTDGPTALVLSRQNLPQLDGTGPQAARGGYILRREKGDNPDLILLASGSEVQLVDQVWQELSSAGVSARVVSMMSFELFLAEPPEYQEEVLPQRVKKRLAVEAALPLGWERFTGAEGAVIGLDHFGASAPGEVLMEKYGFTVERIVERARALLAG
ncbi:MAG: Transketolase [Syntrophomonadaceae bacterium]|nr:Transketolase [Bacillota bacterium]